ncbi:MAG: hypothetical protein GY794_12525 [bacterium]|nr:hypothetical protein [bacterium]
MTTNIGVEGMVGNVPRPGLVANTIKDIANAAIKLYQDIVRGSIAMPIVQGGSFKIQSQMGPKTE